MDMKIRLENCPEFIGAPELSEIFGFSRTTIWRLRKSGKLNTYLVGGTIFYKTSEVEQLVKDGENKENHHGK
jgi:predicted DNA-binding transcriptional regulator AlpA